MDPSLDNPIGHLAVEKTSATVDFAFVRGFASLATEDDDDFETEAGDLMIVE